MTNETTDTPLEVKLISQGSQQAAPVAVPDDWKAVPVNATGEMVEALKARIGVTSRGGILNAGHALNAAIAAAPTPPAFERVSILKDVPVRYGANAGSTAVNPGAPLHGSSAPTPPAQQPVAWVLFHNGEVAYDRDELIICNLPGDRLDESYEWRRVYAAQPAQQSQWVNVSERLPDETEDDGSVVIEAIHKAGEKVVTSTRYLRANQHNFISWRLLPSAPGDTAAPGAAKQQPDGWVVISPDGSMGEVYTDKQSALDIATDCDRELSTLHTGPAHRIAPVYIGDTAAPEQDKPLPLIDRHVIVLNGYQLKEALEFLAPDGHPS